MMVVTEAVSFRFGLRINGCCQSVDVTVYPATTVS